jgi:hypothetical protein
VKIFLKLSKSCPQKKEKRLPFTSNVKRVVLGSNSAHLAARKKEETSPKIPVAMVMTVPPSNFLSTSTVLESEGSNIISNESTAIAHRPHAMLFYTFVYAERTQTQCLTNDAASCSRSGWGLAVNQGAVRI